MMKSILGLMLATGLILFVGCSDDDDNGGLSTFEVTAITASGTDADTGEPVSDIDLYGATAADNVPVDATIEIVFDQDIDGDDASDHITVTGGAENPDVTATASGNIVTVTFADDLEGGTTYTLNIDDSIEGFLGGLFNEDVTVTFTTAGRPEVTPPQEGNLTFYMDFDGELVDATGNYEVGFNEVSGYEEDRFGTASAAARFDGNGDMIDISNSENLLSESMTISFWMLVDAADTNKLDHSFSIVGAAAEKGFFIELGGPENSSWIKPPTSHMDPDGNFGTAWSDAINGGGNTNEVVTTAYEGNVDELFDDKWTHFVLTYDAATSIKTVYIDGEIVRQEDFTNQEQVLQEMAFNDVGVEETINKDLGIGFYGSSTNAATEWAMYPQDTPENANTFSGALDDLRIWDIALTQDEVEQLYDAES